MHTWNVLDIGIRGRVAHVLPVHIPDALRHLQGATQMSGRHETETRNLRHSASKGSRQLVLLAISTALLLALDPPQESRYEQHIICRIYDDAYNP